MSDIYLKLFLCVSPCHTLSPLFSFLTRVERWHLNHVCSSVWAAVPLPPAVQCKVNQVRTPLILCLSRKSLLEHVCDTDRLRRLSSTCRLLASPPSCTESARWTLLPPGLSDPCEASLRRSARRSARSPQLVTRWLWEIFVGANGDKSADIMVIKRLTGSGKGLTRFLSLPLPPSISFCLLSRLPYLIALLSSWFRYTGAVVYTVICTVNRAWRKGRRRQRETEGCLLWAYEREVDQTRVVEVLEQSHVVEEDKGGGHGCSDTPEEASTKRLPSTQTFPEYISGMSFEC